MTRPPSWTAGALLSALSVAVLRIAALDIYWNVPTNQCPPGTTFNLNEAGIIQNAGGRFAGDEFNIFYSPGMFPQVHKNGKADNGGIPQRGDLAEHLKHLRRDLESRLPSPYAGPAVIDFEEWQTTLRSTGELKYRNLSHAYKLHDHTTSTAEQLFEAASRQFLQGTLETAVRLRPHALWGYYHYPYCKNYRHLKLGVGSCAPAITEDNNNSLWLYNASRALYPSVYLLKNGYTAWEKYTKTRVALDEADRLASRVGGRPVYPYTWFGYHEAPNEYVTPADLVATVGHIFTRQPAGFVIWGSSGNVATAVLCQRLRDYVNSRLVPFLRWLRSLSKRQLEELAQRLAASELSFSEEVGKLRQQGVFGVYP